MSTSARVVTGSKTEDSRRQRLWEVDALRGVAIVMMVIYHLMWDLWFFQVLPDVDLVHGFWKYFQRTTASLFIILVGVSLTLSYRAAQRHGVAGSQLFLKFLRRGLRIFALGMVITVAVSATGVGYVHFGVLHLIGFSIAAAYPFLTLRWANLGLWLAFTAAGYALQPIRVDFPWLAWLGIEPAFYAPVDYFPVIPWFGVVLLGVFLGNTLYGAQGRRFPLPDLSGWLAVRGLDFMGRHSLVIYLVHQPVLLAILALTGVISLSR